MDQRLEDIAISATKEFGEQERMLQTRIHYVRTFPTTAPIPKPTTARLKIADDKAIEQHSKAVNEDKQKLPAFFSLIIAHTSTHSLAVLRARPGYDVALLVFWAYENLKATHETTSIGTAPSRIVKLQLFTAFDTIKQEPKEDIADYKVSYDQK